MNITENDIIEIIDANHGHLCLMKLLHAVNNLLKTRGETLKDDSLEKSNQLAEIVRGCKHLTARWFYTVASKSKDGIKTYRLEAIVYRTSVPDNAHVIDMKGEVPHANVGGGDSKDPGREPGV